MQISLCVITPKLIINLTSILDFYHRFQQNPPNLNRNVELAMLDWLCSCTLSTFRGPQLGIGKQYDQTILHYPCFVREDLK